MVTVNHNPALYNRLRYKIAAFIPPRLATTPQRIITAFIALACLAPLILALHLHPDHRGFGTHEQLNLPPCGFYERTGYPCPTCGMTTAFALTVRGRLLRAWHTQPAGTLAALGCLFLCVVFAHEAATATAWHLWLIRIDIRWIIFVVVWVVLAAWAWRCLLVWWPKR